MPAVLRARRSVQRRLSTRPPLRRIAWAVDRLRSGGTLTAAGIAAQFEISQRTAYRDIDFLRDQLFAPLAYDPGRRSYVLTDPSYSLPPLNVTHGEILSLFFAEKVVRQYRGTPYEDELRTALAKLQHGLSDVVTIDVNPLEGFLSLGLGPVAQPDPGVFRAVVDAVVRHRRLRMTYTSLARGRTAQRTVEPYHVYNLRGDWYLAAFDPRHGAVRDFALHRIVQPTALDETFALDPDFDFAAYLGQAFGIEKGGRPIEVSIRFGPRQARWIREKRWHTTARIQDRLDGGCILRMRVTGLAEVQRWVLQFGPDAEVLSPPSLRRDVAAALRETLRSYRPRRSKRRV